MEEDGVKIVSLGVLLSMGRSPAVLATAIENSGIHGWDRYGRFGRIGTGSPDERAALDALAAEFAAYASDDKVPPSEYDELDSPFSLMGWPKEQLPNLDEIELGQVSVPRPQATARRENATLCLVGALLEFIDGKKSPERRHPLYESDPKLAEQLVRVIGQYPGLGLSTIKSKFKQARDSLEP